MESLHNASERWIAKICCIGLLHECDYNVTENLYFTLEVLHNLLN